MGIQAAIEEALGQPAVDVAPLGGGCIGQVFRLRLADGRAAVAKFDDGPDAQLEVEGAMLRYLAEVTRLPVPAVWVSSPRLLLMAHMPGTSRFSAPAQRHAAELLADLHDITAPAFGFQRDTLIGGLDQPNPWTECWVDFFRDQRLLAMARSALDHGRLPAAVAARIRRLAGRLGRWLEEPTRPSLIHGDVWTTNVLAAGDRITAFVDPAIYYAHPEIELAFITLFGTFQEPFFTRYQERRSIAPGFFEARRDLYNLYPLLVHVRLFGGGYVNSVTAILDRFGV